MKHTQPKLNQSPRRKSNRDEPVDFQRLKEMFHRVADGTEILKKDTPRAKILASAFELFANKGFEATSVRDIAIAAGVNPAMIHYYYSSKDNLYRRVMEAQVAVIAQFISSEIIPTIHSGEEIIFKLPRSVMKMMRDNPLLARLMLREIAEGGKHFEQTVNEMGDRGPFVFAKLLGESYRYAVKQGMVIDLPASQVAPLLIGLSYSTVFIEPFFRILTKHDPESSDLWELRVSLIERLFRYGLAPEKKKATKKQGKK